jgi:ATP-dependent exoDNAse (exonuclease V) alpha subunit
MSVKHQLIIGEAGVGKSRFIKQNYNNEEYLRLGPTGISASSIDAQTISSYFCLGGLNENTVEQSYKLIHFKKRMLITRYRFIVIDEIYTVSTDIMEKVDLLLKKICHNELDFGGKCLIMVGDNAQLPSVGLSFVNSDLFEKLNVTVTDLHYDMEFSRLKPSYREIVNYFRSFHTKNEIIKYINTHFNKVKEPFKDALNVFYENKHVNAHNAKQEKCLGMPIILNKNYDIKNKLYNGRICTFLGFDGSNLKIHIDGEDVILRNYRDFKPAFAITIHKVQGLTLDKINVYLSKNHLDDIKLIYVALSRVRCIDDIYVTFE